MKTIVQVCLFFFLFSFTHPLFAQKKVIPGFYITTQGDTIRGEFPGYTQWKKNPSKVEFIPAETKIQIQLTPLNTQKFVIDGFDEYISYSGDRLLNPIDDQVLLNHNFTIYATDSTEKLVTFLRTIAKTSGGNLFIQQDSRRINFFYQLPGQSIVELRFKKSIEYNRITNMPEYRKQLNSLFPDLIIKRDLASTLKKLPYREAPLSNFFKDLFIEETRQDRKNKSESSLVVSAGLALNMITIDEIKLNYGASVSPVLAIGYLSPIARKFGKYFLYPHLSLTRYKNSAEIKDGSYYIKDTYQADLLATVQLMGGINVVNNENFKFFIAAGLGGIFQLGGRHIQQTYVTADNSPYGESSQINLPVLSYLVDASLGVTLNKKILISTHYMLPAKIARYINYDPKLSCIQLKVGYILK